MNSKVTDADILKEIEENSKRLRGKPRKQSAYTGAETEEISVEISEGNQDSSTMDAAEEDPPTKKQKVLPFFVASGSRIYGGESTAQTNDCSSDRHDDAATEISFVASAKEAGVGDTDKQEKGLGPSSSDKANIEIMGTETAEHVSSISALNSIVIDSSHTAATGMNDTDEDDVKELADIEWEE